MVDGLSHTVGLFSTQLLTLWWCLQVGVDAWLHDCQCSHKTLKKVSFSRLSICRLDSPPATYSASLKSTFSRGGAIRRASLFAGRRKWDSEEVYILKMATLGGARQAVWRLRITLSTRCALWADPIISLVGRHRHDISCGNWGFQNLPGVHSGRTRSALGPGGKCWIFYYLNHLLGQNINQFNCMKPSQSWGGGGGLLDAGLDVAFKWSVTNS